MPIDQRKIRRFDEAMDEWLKQREQDRLDDDEDTDPIQFMESPDKPPIGEPPVAPQEDSSR